MKLVSWNVNGYRAIVNKGFRDFFNDVNADIFCIQETKMQEGDATLDYPEYNIYINSAQKKGYSGTAILTKIKPKSVSYGIGIEEHDKEGRVITLEFNEFFLVNIYTPNSKPDLGRLEYRMIWEDEILKYLNRLRNKKHVIICGDLNVAHQEIDLKNPKQNRKSAGFTNEEREKMTALLSNKYIDTFRYLYPDKIDSYTWWSYFANARIRNIGWRIDYFITSDSLKEKIKEAYIFNEVYGSDHCPVGIEIDVE